MFARAVLKFDISDIPGLPKNADITEVTFSTYYTEGDVGIKDDLCSLFVISKHWEVKETNWSNATKNDKWEQLDLDTKFFNPDLEDTLTFPGGGDRIFPCAATSPVAGKENPWETFTITKVMKKYIKNPDEFHGLYLKPHQDNTGRWYASSEWEEKDKRPKLTIKFISTHIKSKQHIASKFGKVSIVKFPNMLQISVPGIETYRINIFSMDGKNIFKTHGNKKQWITIPYASLSHGIHILQLSNSHKQIFQRLVITK